MTPRWPILILVSLGLAATAQTPAAQTHSEAALHHEIADLLQGSRDQCDLAGAALESLTLAIQQAKQTTDPIRLRSALSEFDAPLREAKHHAGSCGDIVKLAMRSLTLGDDAAHGTERQNSVETPPPAAAKPSGPPPSR